jgi:hypothetical protein
MEWGYDEGMSIRCLVNSSHVHNEYRTGHLVYRLDFLVSYLRQDLSDIWGGRNHTNRCPL